MENLKAIKFTGCDKLGLLLKGMELGQDIRPVSVRRSNNPFISFEEQGKRMSTVFKPLACGRSEDLRGPHAEIAVAGHALAAAVSFSDSSITSLKSLQEAEDLIRARGRWFESSLYMDFAPDSYSHWSDCVDIKPPIDESKDKPWEKPKFISKSKPGVAPNDATRQKLRSKRKKKR